jgi:succinoglycan biosynthesis protein ExoA
VSEDDRNRDVLVVVPCLNEEAHLSALLEGILRNAGAALVVVADGGSTDGSRSIVAAFARGRANLVLLDNPGRIQSAAMNLAARRFGRGRRWLIRVDAHAEYPEGFVDRLCQTARDRAATSVVVPMASSGQACFQKAAAAAQNSVLGTGGAPHRHVRHSGWVEHGHHALFDLRLFMAVGGYDEGFAANEDAELDRRLAAAGGRIWLDPASAITYFPRGNVGSLFRQYRGYGRGRARNLKRHPARVRLRQMLPLGVFPALVAGLAGLVLAPVRPDALLLMLPMLCWLASTLAVGGLLGWRSRSVCGAAAGIAAATMHAGWSLGFIQEALSFRRLPAPPGPLGFECFGAPR